MAFAFYVLRSQIHSIDGISVNSTPPVLILASASPRRRELLGFLGVPFRGIGTDGEERDSPPPPAITAALPPAPLPLATHPTPLTWRKAHAACAEYPESVI